MTVAELIQFFNKYCENLDYPHECEYRIWDYREEDPDFIELPAEDILRNYRQRKAKFWIDRATDDTIIITFSVE